MNMEDAQVPFAARADERAKEDQSTMVALLIELGVPLHDRHRLQFLTVKRLLQLDTIHTLMTTIALSYDAICNIVACMTHCFPYDPTSTEPGRIQTIKAFLQSTPPMTVPLVSFYNGMDIPAMDAYALKLVLRIFDQPSLLSYHDRMEPSSRIGHVSDATQYKLWNALNTFPFVRSTQDLLTQYNYNEHLNAQFANLLVKLGFTQAEIAYVLSELGTAEFVCLAGFHFRLLHPGTNSRFIARERRLLLAKAINFMSCSGQHHFLRIPLFDFS
jgi:hypothetical protein